MNTLDPLISSISYNTVEGPVLNYGASFRKRYDSLTNKFLAFGANVRYGFSDHLFDANANATAPIGGFYLKHLREAPMSST